MLISLLQVRTREVGGEDISEEELRERFERLDSDGSGKVDAQEYIKFSLNDALSRSATRVVDLFRQVRPCNQRAVHPAPPHARNRSRASETARANEALTRRVTAVALAVGRRQEWDDRQEGVSARD